MNDNSPSLIPTRFLSTRELLAALAEFLPRAPCRKTLRKWGRAGLPYIPMPDSPQRLYLLSDVLEWLSRRSQRKDLRQHATDKAFLERMKVSKRIA